MLNLRYDGINCYKKHFEAKLKTLLELMLFKLVNEVIPLTGVMMLIISTAEALHKIDRKFPVRNLKNMLDYSGT